VKRIEKSFFFIFFLFFFYFIWGKIQDISKTGHPDGEQRRHYLHVFVGDQLAQPFQMGSAFQTFQTCLFCVVTHSCAGKKKYSTNGNGDTGQYHRSFEVP